MTDREALRAAYNRCRCGGHTCRRCMQTAAQYRAWMMPLTPAAPSEPVDDKPKKNKNKKEDN